MFIVIEKNNDIVKLNFRCYLLFDFGYLYIDKYKCNGEVCFF